MSETRFDFHAREAALRARTKMIAEQIGKLEVENENLKKRIDWYTKATTSDANILLKRMCEDTSETDTIIRNLCRPYLTELEIEGDNLGVIPLENLVERLIEKFKKEGH